MLQTSLVSFDEFNSPVSRPFRYRRRIVCDGRRACVATVLRRQRRERASGLKRRWCGGMWGAQYANKLWTQSETRRALQSG
ncbi:MAG TPA: hypothetical protein VF634_09255 [Pyrinomonadaceae bacterium]